MAASGRRQHLDYDLIVDLVERDSSVLDLGCGDGELLLRLRDFKSVHGLGVEIEEAMIVRCLARGITVFQGNLNDGLRDHASGSYDYVVLNQTLQQIDRPLELLAEMLRVGRQVIVSFPNFGYLGIRLSLLLRGRMPASRDLPFAWHDTPNIHLCTRNDFLDYCRANRVAVTSIIDIRNGRRIGPTAANLRCTQVLFVLQGDAGPSSPPRGRIRDRDLE
ncbi:MAG: methionine biosynthesis protein MetW [Spirochaetaceae bacterium]|nr:methionine biosynthesis protein MetW [Spirochaetaceae bacterium]